MFFTDVNDARVERLRKQFSNPLTEVMLLFLKSFLPLLTDPNKQLQKSQPQIQHLYGIMTATLNTIISRYASDSDPDFADLENLNYYDGKISEAGTFQVLHFLVLARPKFIKT